MMSSCLVLHPARLSQVKATSSSASQLGCHSCLHYDMIPSAHSLGGRDPSFYVFVYFYVFCFVSPP